MRYRALLLWAAVLGASLRLSLAQNLVDAISTWDGSTEIHSFGVPRTATYGQTITVEANVSPLTSFSFEIGNCSSATTLRGFVYAWDGTRVTGPALYQSAPQTVPAVAGFRLVTFTVPDLTLLPGSYILFGSTSMDQSGAPPSACQWGAILDNNAYAGGQFYYNNGSMGDASWTAGPWSTRAEDLAFRVTGLYPRIPVGGPVSIGFLCLLIATAGTIMLIRRKEHLSH